MLPTGQGGGASHQRGNLLRPPGRLACFPTPAGRLYGFRRQRRYKKWRRRRRTSPAQRYYITPEGGALNPPVRRSRSQAEPWQPRAKGPAAGSTLTPVRACQPSGIRESTAPVPIPTAPQAPEPSRPKGACPSWQQKTASFLAVFCFSIQALKFFSSRISVSRSFSSTLKEMRSPSPLT